MTAGTSDDQVDDWTSYSIEKYCELMHDAYERAALGAGWETQQASRKPWADVPEANKATMRAAVRALVPVVAQDALERSALVWDHQLAPMAAWLRQSGRLERAGIHPLQADAGEQALRIVEAPR